MSEWTDLGRTVVVNGDLKKLRKRLGLNRSSMAELLRTSMATYDIWEVGKVRLWPTTAERIGRFYHLANEHLVLLQEDGIILRDFMPLHQVTIALGVPLYLLLKRLREKAFEAEDLGILGLWIYKLDLEKIRDIL